MATLHRHAQVTPNDHGPLVNVASWILMVVGILFTSFRLVSNVYLRGRFGKHDFCIMCAVAFAIAQSIATSLMVQHGLGQHEDSLSAAMIVSFQKSQLAASILYIATVATNKLSLLVFVWEILAASQTQFMYFIIGACSVTGLYVVSATFALSFACNLPATYNYFSGQCFNLLGFWDFHAVFDIIFCLVIFILPIMIVYPLQMRRSLKSQVILPFGLELFLIAFAIIRLIYIHRSLHAEDHTWSAVNWQIWTQISMHLGVVAANIPCLKIFFKAFQSVLFRTETTRLQTDLRSYGNNSGAGHQSGKGGMWSVKGGGWGRKGNGSGGSKHNKQADQSWAAAVDGESATAIVSSSAPEHQFDTLSQSDNKHGEPGIYKTTEWTVLKSSDDDNRL